MPRHLFGTRNLYLESPIYNYSFGDKSSQQQHTKIASPAQEDEKNSPLLRPYHAATIVDPRLNRINPSSWTEVSKDDNLMRAMLQHFFMYDYQWHTSFQKDYFLDDMVSGSREFCSPLLVNSILALVCVSEHSSIGMSNRNQFWDPETLSFQFIAEGKRLWDMEAGTARLTTVHAGLLLYLAHALCGKDGVGKSYLIQSVAIAESLGIFKRDGGRVGDRAQDARDFTAWAMFTSFDLQFHSHNQWYFQDRPLLDAQPDVPLPDVLASQDWFGEIWLKYPLSDKLHAAHFGASFRAYILLSVILNDVACKHYSHEDQKPVFSLRDILGYYKRLEQWYRDLPTALAPGEIFFPAMHYYNTIIRLMVAAVKLQESSICSNLDRWTAKRTPQQLLSDAAVSLETLVRLYYVRHSFERLDTFLVQPLTELSTVLQTGTGARHVQDAEALRSTLLLCAQGLRDQGRNHYLGQVLFHLAREHAGPELRGLIDKHLYPGPQAEAPLAAVLSQQVHSNWPANLISALDEAKNLRLSAVLKRLESSAMKATDVKTSGRGDSAERDELEI
ncbi:C6 transcription factor [Cordyceps javanica]|uniref:C6 transcription factor n=1 Tax=Cordyceps javanica TaxID=43265 RepID=A0A545VBA3_9HYPO|nr:C6 transcription factor [Cordyceps javanica]